MGTPFLSEIRIFAFSFPPKGWAFCNGQLMSIQQNTALFSLLGTTYGGNGTTNFQLPNLQGQVPLMYNATGGSYTLGETGGEINHTLLLTEIPSHVHTMQGSNTAGTTGTPTGAALAQPSSAIGNAYAPPGTNLTTMSPQAIANTGGSQPHSNQQPYLVLNFCISLLGIFPSRT